MSKSKTEPEPHFKKLKEIIPKKTETKAKKTQ